MKVLLRNYFALPHFNCNYFYMYSQDLIALDYVYFRFTFTTKSELKFIHLVSLQQRQYPRFVYDFLLRIQLWIWALDF